MHKNRNKKIIMVFIAVMLLWSMHILADNIRAEAVSVSEGDADIFERNAGIFEENANVFGESAAIYEEGVVLTEENVTVSGSDAPLITEMEGLKQQEYAVYQNQLNAQLCSLRLVYLTMLEELRKEQWEIEQAKVKLGYAIPIAAKEAEAQYKAVQLQIETAKAQQQFYMEVLQLYGREYQEIQVPDNLEELQTDYVDEFLRDSAKKEYDGRQNREQYEIHLKIYVKGLVLQYENTRRKVKEADIQISVLKGKIANAVQLYEAGRMTKAQLGELEAELKGLEYERMDLIYNAQLILYQLTHKIADS